MAPVCRSYGPAARPPIGCRPGLVSGEVFVDLDGDLQQTAGEPPLVGVTLMLPDAAGDEVGTAVADPAGAYVFADLAPLDYTIRIDASTVPDGHALAADRDGDAGGDAAASLIAGEDVTDRDFVYRGTGAIGDLVWLEADGDTIPDDGERPSTSRSTWSGRVPTASWRGTTTGCSLPDRRAPMASTCSTTCLRGATGARRTKTRSATTWWSLPRPPLR